MKEIKIRTQSPTTADDILQSFGILMQGGGKGLDSDYKQDKNGNYFARSMNDDTGFAEFAIKNQGYDIEIIT